MASQTQAVQTGHTAMIHDAQLDYYGKRLATASSDRSIKVFEVNNNEYKLLDQLSGHDGPVWQVAWSHPQFDNLLASCSYDCKIKIWKQQNDQWVTIFEDQSHKSSVNSIAWAPHTLGLILACGSSDGSVSVFEYKDKQWLRAAFQAHAGGVNAVSWSPDAAAGAVLNNQNTPPQKRLVTGGCDNSIKIWGFNPQSGSYEQQPVFEGKTTQHDDWVRDVAWAPSSGLPRDTIASCSEDKTVKIWTRGRNGMWTAAKTLSFPEKVWKVSWSTMGNILAVSQGDNQVTLYKESLSGEWEELNALTDQSSESQVQTPQQS